MENNQYPEYISGGLILLGLYHPLFFVALAIYCIYLLFRKDKHIHEETRDIDPQLSNFLFMKHQYLKSDVWRTKRAARFEHDRYLCQHCFTSDNLEVHHLYYSQIPTEPLDHIITLCRSCHQKEHDLKGYPSTYSEYMRWGHS